MIAAFCYSWPHTKTVNGLLSLAAHGYSNVICLAAPKKQLNIPHSKIRITPITEPLHPKQVAQALGFKYIEIEHDSEEIKDLIRDCKVGVILGARIIKKHIVELLPIINMHPGDTLVNKGLDNIKNSIYMFMPQVITAHVIDQYIDRGFVIEKRLIPVYEDDTMLDIFIRMQSVEQHLLISAIDKVLIGDYSKERTPKGNYFSAMTIDLEHQLVRYFEIYKRNYVQIAKKFKC